MDGMDRGWAWVVALAAMIINFIMAGLGRMSGILYVAFIEMYGVDRKGASMPFSVRSSARNLLGPVVGILGQKYGVQSIIIAGGIIGSVSTVFCFFASDILWITILFGGLGGIGAAFSTSLNQVVIGQYFKKYRTTAGGMGFSGGCIGSFLFPALMEYLLSNYGIDGTFLFIAGITMHTIPAALIMKKPPWLKDRQEATKSGESAMGSLESDKNLPKENRDSEDPLDAQYLRRNKELVIALLMADHQKNTLNNTCAGINSKDSKAVIESCVWESMEDIICSVQLPHEQYIFRQNERLSKNNIFCDMVRKDDAKHFNDLKSQSVHLEKNSKTEVIGHWNKACSEPDVSTVSDDISKSYVLLKIKNMLTISDTQILSSFPHESRSDLVKVLSEIRKLYRCLQRTETETSLPQSDNQERSHALTTNVEMPSNTFWTHIKTAIRLHGNPLFILISLSRAVHLITFVPVVTTVVDFSLDRGFPEDYGKYVIAVLSLGDLLGRLCLGWVTDRGYMELPKYMVVAMVVQGVVTCVLPLMPSRVTILITLAVFGMLQGSLFVRHPVLVNKYFGINVQSVAMGCMNFFSGLMALILPLYIGYFRDTLGSYDYIFFINGVVGVIIGSLWVLEPFFVRFFSSNWNTDDES